MFIRGRAIQSRSILNRLYSSVSEVEASKATKAPPVSPRERSKFAAVSIKDIFDGFLTNEESFDPIDTKPILANPRSFVQLSTFHRDQVIEEVTKRLRRNWKDVPIETKRMAYFISYGNWGVREDLKDNLYADAVPEDLSFNIPSQIRLIDPKPTDKIKKLPEVDLMQVSESRRKEWKRITRTLDPLSKFVVYFAITISIIALWRDKYIGENDIDTDFESPLMIAERKRQEELDAKKALQDQRLKEEETKKTSGKKWYYLWLK